MSSPLWKGSHRAPHDPALERALIALGRAIGGIRNPKWGAVLRISHSLEAPLSELARRAEEVERTL